MLEHPSKQKELRYRDYADVVLGVLGRLNHERQKCFSEDERADVAEICSTMAGKRAVKGSHFTSIASCIPDSSMSTHGN